MTFSIRQFFFFAVLLAVPITSYILVFKPQNEEMAKARQQIAHKRAMLDKLREATGRTEDLQRANEEVRATIEQFEARLPSRKEMDAVLRQVATIAEQNKLRVPEFKKSDKSAPAGLALEQPLEIQIEGNFDGFYQFLLELEQLQRITRVHQMKIWRAGLTKKRNTRGSAPQTDEYPPGAIDVEFVLSIYYESRPEAAEGAAVASR